LPASDQEAAFDPDPVEPPAPQTVDAHARYRALRDCRDPPSLWALAAAAAASCRRRLAGPIAALLGGPRCAAGNAVGPASPDGPADEAGKALEVEGRRLEMSLTPIARLKVSDSEDPTPQGVAAVAGRAGPLGVPAEWRRVVEEHFVASVTATERFGLLDRNRLVERAVAQVALGNVWDTSRPVAATLCKPWVNVLIFLSSAIYVASLTLILGVVRGNNVAEGRQFRFTALQRRSDAMDLPGLGPSIEALGLLLDGCGQGFLSLPVVANASGSAFTIAFPGAVRMNGWWFRTPAAAPAGADPVRFRLEARDEVGGAGIRSN
jgi:hypothetical protein